MSDNKLEQNPDFTEDTILDEGDDEVKEPLDDESEGEGEPSESSPEEEPVDQEVNDDDALTREQQALKQQEEKLKRENEEIKRRIVEQRQLRREQRDKEREQPPQQQEVDLSDIEQEDIDRMERVLKAKGYVPKSEILEENYKQTQKQIEDDFFDQHPEYKPENDAGDTLYNALRSEFGLYAKPETAAQVKTILSRAHKQVREQFPDRFPQSASQSSTRDKARTTRKNIASAGSGGSGSSRTQASGSSLTPEQRQQLRDGGFSDEEIEQM